jgi:FkbM family methyltransferase
MTAQDKELSRQLEELLVRDASKLRERERSLFDELVDTADPLVLFGAGGLGRKTLRGLRAMGRTVLAFTDNNPRLHGQHVDGVPVYSVSDASARFGQVATFVSTVFMDSAPLAFRRRRAEFLALGCRNVQPFYPLYWQNPAIFLPHYAYDLPHKVVEAGNRVRAAWDLLSDDISRQEFLGQIRWRLDPSFEDLPPSSEGEMYFPSDIFKPVRQEVFVDCGAYDGDTVLSFVRNTGGVFSKAYVFEPDPGNFEKLKHQIACLPLAVAEKIRAAQFAIGATAGVVSLDAQGGAASVISPAGQFAVRCETIDSALGGDVATYVKMDIEGAEIDALNGASAQIKRHGPALAMSAYHLQEHLWELPLLAHSLCAHYRFYLRRYGPVPFDNLVMYAIPATRH